MDSRCAVQMNVSLFSSMMFGDLAGLRIDPDQPVSLVPAIDLLVGEMPAVLVPAQPRLLEVDPVDRWA